MAKKIDINEAYKKLNKVVKSIETREQAKSAYNYFLLWQKAYKEYQWLVAHNPRFAWVDGNILGYLNGFLKTKV